MEQVDACVDKKEYSAVVVIALCEAGCSGQP